MEADFQLLFDRAQRALHGGFAEHALVPATEAAKLAPDRWDARLLLARVWLAQGGTERALVDARRALELGGDSIPPEDRRRAHDVIAQAALRKKDLAAAEAALRIVCEDPGEHAARTRLLGLLLEDGRVGEARTLASEEAEKDPRFEPALRPLALALAGDGVTEAAAGVPSVQLALADLEVESGLLGEAKSRYQAELGRDPDSFRAAEGLRFIAGGAKAKDRPARASAGESPRAIAVARFVFGGLGVSMVAWTFWRWDLIAALGVPPPLFLLLGAGIAVTAFLARSKPGKTTPRSPDPVPGAFTGDQKPSGPTP